MVRKPSPEKRNQFLDAALKLFVANGVQQTSTAAIAQAAGTAAGTLFLYFPTKQDLVNQLALKIGREQSEYVNSLLQPSQSARETFLAIWNGSLHWFLDHMDAYKFSQQIRTSNLVDELILNIAREQSEYINSQLQPSLPARETFLAIWQGSIRWFLENMDAYKYFRQVKDSHLVSDAVTQESGKYFVYYFTAIQKGLAEGAIQAYPVELIGEMLSQDLAGAMNLIERQPDASKQEEYIRLGFDLFWDGIKMAGN